MATDVSRGVVACARAINGADNVRYVANTLEGMPAVADGSVQYFDPSEEYLGRLRQLVDVDRIRASSLKLVADPMYGAGMSYFPRLLSGSCPGVPALAGQSLPRAGTGTGGGCAP